MNDTVTETTDAVSDINSVHRKTQHLHACGMKAGRPLWPNTHLITPEDLAVAVEPFDQHFENRLVIAARTSREPG